MFKSGTKWWLTDRDCNPQGTSTSVANGKQGPRGFRWLHSWERERERKREREREREREGVGARNRFLFFLSFFFPLNSVSCLLLLFCVIPAFTLFTSHCQNVYMPRQYFSGQYVMPINIHWTELRDWKMTIKLLRAQKINKVSTNLHTRTLSNTHAHTHTLYKTLHTMISVPSATQDRLFCSQAYNHLTPLVCSRLHSRPSEIHQAPPHQHIIHIQPWGTAETSNYNNNFGSTSPSTPQFVTLCELLREANCQFSLNEIMTTILTTACRSLSAQNTSDTWKTKMITS